MRKLSGFVCIVSSLWFVARSKSQGPFDFSSNPLCVFQDVLVTADSHWAVVNIVTDTVVAGITWTTTFKSTTVNPVFDAFSTFIRGIIKVTKFALVAEWSTKGPIASWLVEVSKSKSFKSFPHIVADCGSAGSSWAEAWN